MKMKRSSRLEPSCCQTDEPGRCSRNSCSRAKKMKRERLLPAPAIWLPQTGDSAAGRAVAGNRGPAVINLIGLLDLDKLKGQPIIWVLLIFKRTGRHRRYARLLGGEESPINK